MPDSIARLVRGMSVLRLLSIATLLLIVACIIIGASIALADVPRVSGTTASGTGGTNEVDTYEFDFTIEAETLLHPVFDEFITYRDI